jgi:hypothetical protein
MFIYIYRLNFNKFFIIYKLIYKLIYIYIYLFIFSDD